jgi:hypothetical protein
VGDLAAPVVPDVGGGLGGIGMDIPIGFATGGSFDVGGFGGTDSQLVKFRATPGEKVSIQTPEQQQASRSGGSPGGGVTHNWFVTTPDASSFMRSQSQISHRADVESSRAARRNG